MDIQARKIEFMKGFLQIQNEDTISKFEDLLNKIKDNPKKMTLKELNTRIDTSEKDFEKGNYKTTKELLHKYV